ncbi:unnamed protein product [Durusdinium trenchii]|uniref:AB hydrolase-1 domain-containing protein n=1 Tax=Durusdinium trenchii TaxID=1381693 RepID=A0ABP0PQV5_9DINO
MSPGPWLKFLLRCLLVTRALRLTGGAALHPRYERVDGDVETLWQRPEGPVKGLFFIAHGCNHQAPDVFTEVTETGETFKECASSIFGKCLGLPEEVALRHYALSRGYVVMAVSGGDGRQSCWSAGDLERVAAAVAHVRKEEKLSEMPLLAMGASSGGAFVGLLPSLDASSGIGKLACIVPEIMGVNTDVNEHVPTLFIHMPRDSHTAHAVKDLTVRKVRTGELRAEPQKVSAQFLTKCLKEDQAQRLSKAFQEQHLVDSQGFLREDPRHRRWIATAESVLGFDAPDSLVADESCLAEVMNVAWAKHEFTAQFAEEIFDFCEGKELKLAQMAPGWKTELGPIEVFEFGPKQGPLAVAIHGMAKSMLHEWDHTAKALAEEGYHVLLPNFHSMSNGLTPGTISSDSVSIVVKDLMRQSSNNGISMLLGKSWGGGMASKISQDTALKVQKMVLVAPAELNPWPETCAVALFWAEDDAVVPIRKAETHPELQQKLTLFHKEKTGGHRVLDAYVPLIRHFSHQRAEAHKVELLQKEESAKRSAWNGLHTSFKVSLIGLLGLAVPGYFLYRRRGEKDARGKRLDAAKE